MVLIKRVKEETLRKEWRTICLLFAQLIVVMLIVVEFLQIIGLHINFHLKQIVLKPIDPLDSPLSFIILGIAILLFALLYLEVKKRNPLLSMAEKKAPGAIKEAAKQKLSKIKTEPQAPALLFIDFLFVVVVVLAIRAYLDPEIEIIPWSAVGVFPPFTTIINAVLAVLVLGAFYYIYSFTAAYRKR